MTSSLNNEFDFFSNISFPSLETGDALVDWLDTAEISEFEPEKKKRKPSETRGSTMKLPIKRNHNIKCIKKLDNRKGKSWRGVAMNADGSELLGLLKVLNMKYQRLIVYLDLTEHKLICYLTLFSATFYNKVKMLNQGMEWSLMEFPGHPVNSINSNLILLLDNQHRGVPDFNNTNQDVENDDQEDGEISEVSHEEDEEKENQYNINENIV